jgi:hypothetical protein
MGDDDGFREFVTARSPALLRTAYLLLGDRALAEDLLQTALVKAYRHWGRVTAGGNPEGYVRRIMVNERRTWWRRNHAPLPLTGGLAVFPTVGGASKVSISRGGVVLGTGSLNQFDGLAKPGPDPLKALVDKAIKDGPPGTDAGMVWSIVQLSRIDLRDATSDPITGVRVLWAGSTNKGRPAVVVAVTVPSGASYVADRSGYPDGTSGGSGGGLVAAGQLDRTVYALGNRFGLIVVVPKGATRAEVVLTGGDVQQVPLRYGGAFVAPTGGAEPLKVRAFDKDGNLVAEQVPNEGLLRP